MYRVTFTALSGAVLSAAVLAAGCSTSPVIGTGYAPGLEDDGLVRLSPAPSGTASRPSGGGARVASLDQAPVGSYETAPTGALSDRDYSRTSLDPAVARDIINQYRADKGLKPLALDAKLTAAAKAHARDLAKWDRISHYGSDGSNPWDRVKRTGYPARLAAENVGTGQVTFKEVMRGWKESEGHNKNLLLADARHMGIALVQDPKTEFKSFWTLVLGSDR